MSNDTIKAYDVRIEDGTVDRSVKPRYTLHVAAVNPAEARKIASYYYPSWEIVRVSRSKYAIGLSERRRTFTQAAIDQYAEQLALLRQHAADAQRDTYAVALGQLRRLDLISERTWRRALDLSRIA